MASWPSSTLVPAAVSGHSIAGQVTPVPDILMVAGTYHVGHSGHSSLFTDWLAYGINA